MAADDTEMLESEEAARRLGVKLATLYAYVSRGLLESHPVPGSRRRVVRRGDVERLATRARQGKEVESRLVTVVTGVTHLGDDGPSYRGRPVAELVGAWSYEEAAELLWLGPGGAGAEPWVGAPVGPAPASLADADRLRWAVVAAGGADPFRRDLRADALRAAGRRIVATMVEALPSRSSKAVPALVVAGRRRERSVAQALTARLAPGPATAPLVAAVDAALVTMADHELATSTLAARVAASGRADLYGIVLAGLGAMAGPLHGSVSNAARDVLVDAHDRGAAPAVAHALGRGSVPGFGHAVYRGVDPRALWLLERVDALATPAQRATLADVQKVVDERGLPSLNAELALGALGWVGGLVAEAGELILSVARVAGWTAHAMEELAEPPLRFRARAVYAQRG